MTKTLEEFIYRRNASFECFYHMVEGGDKEAIMIRRYTQYNANRLTLSKIKFMQQLLTSLEQ